MRSIFFILALATFTLVSCNYKLFVNKRQIVQKEHGYLVFTGDYGVFFFPSKDTVDAKFLSDKEVKEGYKVEFETDWLDSLSVDYTFSNTSKGEKLSIIPVRITFYLGDSWQEKDEQSYVEYSWDNEMHKLKYKQHDWRQILMISVVREEDKKRLKERKSGLFPLHY